MPPPQPPPAALTVAAAALGHRALLASAIHDAKGAVADLALALGRAVLAPASAWQMFGD